MDALVGNAQDVRQVKEARKRVSHRERTAALDWQTLLAQPAFRRRVWWLLEQLGVYEANEEQTEHARGRKEGKRQVGLMLIDKLQSADPLAYVNLILEQAQAKQKQAALPDPELTDGESPDAEAGIGAGAEPEPE